MVTQLLGCAAAPNPTTFPTRWRLRIGVSQHRERRAGPAWCSRAFRHAARARAARRRSSTPAASATRSCCRRASPRRSPRSAKRSRWKSMRWSTSTATAGASRTTASPTPIEREFFEALITRRVDRPAFGRARVFAADVGDRPRDRSRRLRVLKDAARASGNRRRATSSQNCRVKWRSSC